jgi:hypothetical protein
VDSWIRSVVLAHTEIATIEDIRGSIPDELGILGTTKTAIVPVSLFP